MPFKKPAAETNRIFLLMGIVILIFLCQAVLRPGSVTFVQVMNTTRQASALGIVVLGQAVVILSGGIDLSVGAVLTLSNVISVTMMNGRDELFLPALAVSLFLTAGIGFLNGLITLKLRIAPFITTLCTMSIVQGGYLVYTGGAPKGSASPVLRGISTGYWLDVIPYSTLIWLFTAALIGILLKYSVFGRQLYMVGSNLAASRLSGISTDRIQIAAFTLSGLFAGIAGLLMSGYTGTSSLTVGSDYINNTLACVLIGGNAIAGGRGGVAGITLSSFLLMLLFALLTMLNLGQVGKLIVQGLIIFVVVALQNLAGLASRET
jgi:ribose/xylose/arabinose/galactoside ABC-type transport system permease subunit